MPEASILPLPTAELVARLIAAERDTMVGWLRAMEAVPGNPFGIAIRDFGQATALVCREVPAEVFNRVFGLTAADREQVPAIVAFYREQGATPLFDLSPYAVEPCWVQPNITDVLARQGFYQGAFHQIMYGVPAWEVPPPPPGVTVTEVGPNDAPLFGQVYEQVWGSGDQIRVLICRPGFRCYLAWLDGAPAALGVLHIAEGVGSMANGLTAPEARGRGCHTALLQRRVHDAALAGCDLLASQCMPGAPSQHNQWRAGLRIAGSKAWWVPGPPGLIDHPDEVP